MKHHLMSLTAAAIIVAACSPKKDGAKDAASAPETQSTQSTPKSEMGTQGEAYNLQAQYDKFAEVRMDVDTSYLSASERAVVNKLIEASRLMSEIYLRQRDPKNPYIRAEIANSKRPDRDLLLKMFDEHFGVCDTLEESHVFYGDTPCPIGAGFYPPDMSKDEFEAWIVAHPDDEAAFRSGYTVIRRDGDRLIAIPYSQEYKQFLEPAAQLLREASELSENKNLKKFLKLRADAFLSDDYYESEMAWMDLDGVIEVAIGPYEVYTDGLYGYKTAFESFVTIKNPEESAALDKYKHMLRDMELNLPVEDKYKNLKRGFASPIAVTYQVQGGGDNVPGVQTIAFNLPNDERVREAKGAKKVLLNNILGAKYDRILAPIGKRVLEPEQAALTVKKYMSYDTLFHELSHSLGPGTIKVDGKETTVNAQLKELYSGIEEGKADVMGVYNILFMMERGELPAEEKQSLLATYFTGLFRSMRFGIDEAHGMGAAFQYTYFREVGAAEWVEADKHFKLDYDKLEQAVSDLTGMVVRLEGDGDYDAVKAFLDTYAQLDDAARTVLGKLDDIPTDIRPIYPDKI